jgi:hypothetical protein
VQSTLPPCPRCDLGARKSGSSKMGPHLGHCPSRVAGSNPFSRRRFGADIARTCAYKDTPPRASVQQPPHTAPHIRLKRNLAYGAVATTLRAARRVRTDEAPSVTDPPLYDRLKEVDSLSEIDGRVEAGADGAAAHRDTGTLAQGSTNSTGSHAPPRERSPPSLPPGAWVRTVLKTR